VASVNKVEPTNWLKAFDEATTSWPPVSADWWYGGFALIRHPHLRPHRQARGTPADDVVRSVVHGVVRTAEAKRRAIQNDDRIRVVLSKRRSGGEGADETSQPVASFQLKDVLNKLSRTQQRQLAALMVDIEAALDDTSRSRQRPKFWERAEQDVRRTESLFKQNAQIIAFAQRLRYACPPSLALPKSERYLLNLIRSTVNQTLERHQNLEAERQRLEKLIEETRALAQSEDPRTFALVQLYWFFHWECDLSDTESQVRTAMVRNTLTPEDPITFHLHQGAHRRGSEAVRQTVHRYHR
jgi:hypothetical protein